MKRIANTIITLCTALVITAATPITKEIEGTWSCTLSNDMPADYTFASSNKGSCTLYIPNNSGGVLAHLITPFTTVDINKNTFILVHDLKNCSVSLTPATIEELKQNGKDPAQVEAFLKNYLLANPMVASTTAVNDTVSVLDVSDRYLMVTGLERQEHMRLFKK